MIPERFDNLIWAMISILVLVACTVVILSAMPDSCTPSGRVQLVPSGPPMLEARHG